ncbi:MAG: translation initiation factor IF-5A [archaeon]|nr:translation initiation factor IF-5A [archaeon]
MALKLITAHEARTGTTILIDGNACIVKSNDVSKTGKHGASKCRIEAIGVLDGKKRIVAVPGSERFDVPLIEKKKAQELSITENGEMANIMDLESFETMDLVIMEEAKGTFNPEDQVEYMIVDERIKVIKRKL